VTHIHEILAKLPAYKIAAIHEGAAYREGLGPKSSAAIETRPWYLDREIGKAINGSEWGWASKYLNEFNEYDMRQRLGAFETATVRALHDGAVATPGVGPQSGAALITAAVLEERKNAPAPPVDREGEMLYAAISQGVEQSSPGAFQLASACEDLLPRRPRPPRRADGLQQPHGRHRGREAGRHLPGALEKIIRLVRVFAPKSDPGVKGYPAGPAGPPKPETDEAYRAYP